MNKEEAIFHSLAIIEERILEKLSIEYLAHDIYLSKYHYQRLFREIIGDSVMHYITRRRISLAAKELVTTNTTILEIALKYGYETHEGFTRSFQTIMGVSPMKYRKYHLLSHISIKQEGELYMSYSKITETILKEFNVFIVQLKETAEYTRKYEITISEASTFYNEFWDSIATRTDSIADKLQTILYRITDISQYSDEISTRFLLIKTIEDALFQFYVTSFQVGLTISRAKPIHKEFFEPICQKYTTLSKNAEIKSDKVVEFFQELTTLIFSDIKTNAKQLIQKIVEKGTIAASMLINHCNYPYAYIAEQITIMTNTLSSLPLNNITISMLEDYKLQIDILSFTFDIDVMRTPSHKYLLDSILAVQESIKATIEFFQTLSTDFLQTPTEAKNESSLYHSQNRTYTKLSTKINILLFYLKGELQKLEYLYLNEKQKESFHHICCDLALIIQALKTITGERDFNTIKENLKTIYQELTIQATELGVYGTAIQYIANELQNTLT